MDMTLAGLGRALANMTLRPAAMSELDVEFAAAERRTIDATKEATTYRHSGAIWQAVLHVLRFAKSRTQTA